MSLLIEENRKEYKSLPQNYPEVRMSERCFLCVLSWSYFCSASSAEVALHLNSLAFQHFVERLEPINSYSQVDIVLFAVAEGSLWRTHPEICLVLNSISMKPQDQGQVKLEHRFLPRHLRVAKNWFYLSLGRSVLHSELASWRHSQLWDNWSNREGCTWYFYWCKFK